MPFRRTPLNHELRRIGARRRDILARGSNVINTEDNPGVAARFRVQSIPSLVVLRDGQPVFQQAGLVPRAQMRRWLEAAQAHA